MLDYPILSPLSNPICANFSFLCIAYQLHKTGMPTPETDGRSDFDSNGGCIPDLGWNSLAGNQCQRWLALFTVFGRDAVQAPGLTVRWRPSVGAGARAGTRPARKGI